MKARVFSGIQPTGDIHIGNYLGAIKNWVELINKYDCIFCVVDYHAMTVQYNPQEMSARTLNAVMDNMACGLDPDRCTIFVQSHVPEHTELTWILNTVTYMGDLSRMTQFKDKSKQNEQNINAGLFTYPILMAADILLYKATVVPVGEDQVQHLELARRIARHFNSRFSEIFKEPEPYLSSAARILGIDGKNKMSKSLNNHIALSFTEKEVSKRIISALTDENRKRRADPGNPDVCNIFTFHKFFSPQSTIDEVNRECRIAGIGCVDCKKKLIPNMMNVLLPIQEKRAELAKNPDYGRDVLKTGVKRCKEIAGNTIKEVKKACGLFEL